MGHESENLGASFCGVALQGPYEAVLTFLMNADDLMAHLHSHKCLNCCLLIAQGASPQVGRQGPNPRTSTEEGSQFPSPLLWLVRPGMTPSMSSQIDHVPGAQAVRVDSRKPFLRTAVTLLWLLILWNNSQGTALGCPYILGTEGACMLPVASYRAQAWSGPSWDSS